MNEVVFKTLKEKDFIVKNYLLKVALELRLSVSELILLIYFSNQEEPILNIASITASTFLEEEEIMAAFSKLVGIGLISMNVIKNADGTREEVISLDNLFKQITTDITKRHSSKEREDIFTIYEREFGRPLSPIELEIINEWINSGINNELIIQALHESIYNGSRSLRNIGKILLAWQQKGYKSKSDIYMGLKKESEDNILVDLVDTNWLEEDD